MQMSERQKRLWKNMIDIIQSYLDEKTSDFYKLIGSLEGMLDASEINDARLVNEWHEFWTPLEIRRSMEGNKVDKNKAFEELKKMRDFLLKYNG